MIVGVDEAGRGPLAGSVVAAAVILPDQYDMPGLDDSKKITEKRREQLEPLIKAQALDWAIGIATVSEIDTLNILQASLLAMTRAVQRLSTAPKDIQQIRVDGTHVPEALTDKGIAVIGGDGLHAEIGAASILAKVERDRQMIALAEEFPGYGFEKHKGYPTAAHLTALAELGVTPIHRRSFKPVAKFC